MSKLVVIFLALIVGATLVVTVIATTQAPSGVVIAAKAISPVQQDTVRYAEYEPQRFAQLAHQRRVLFFKADWCVGCTEANEDIAGHASELPSDVTVFKVNYDREQSLRNQYLVTVQHTFVLVDEQGRALQTWVGGGMDELVNRVSSDAPSS